MSRINAERFTVRGGRPELPRRGMNPLPEPTLTDDTYFIWSHEHGQWWRANHSGYTWDILDAGRYSYDQAKEIITKANYNGRIQEEGILVADRIAELMEVITQLQNVCFTKATQ